MKNINEQRIVPDTQRPTGDIITQQKRPDNITGTHFKGRDVSQISNTGKKGTKPMAEEKEEKKSCYQKCMEDNYTNPRKCDDSEGNCKESAAKHCREQCGGTNEDYKNYFKNRINTIIEAAALPPPQPNRGAPRLPPPPPPPASTAIARPVRYGIGDPPVVGTPRTAPSGAPQNTGSPQPQGGGGGFFNRVGQWVKNNPGKSALIAGGAGLLVGAALARGSRTTGGGYGRGRRSPQVGGINIDMSGVVDSIFRNLQNRGGGSGSPQTAPQTAPQGSTPPPPGVASSRSRPPRRSGRSAPPPPPPPPGAAGSQSTGGPIPVRSTPPIRLPPPNRPMLPPPNRPMLPPPSIRETIEANFKIGNDAPHNKNSRTTSNEVAKKKASGKR